MARCDMCFKEKIGLVPPIPRLDAKVCKGCFYEIDRVVGFLEHYGFVLQGILGGRIEDASKSKKKASKPGKGTHPLETP